MLSLAVHRTLEHRGLTPTAPLGRGEQGGEKASRRGGLEVSTEGYVLRTTTVQVLIIFILDVKGQKAEALNDLLKTQQ